MRTKKSNQEITYSRLEQWKENKYLDVIYTFKSDKVTEKEERLSKLLYDTRLEYYKGLGEKPPTETISDWIERCKELIFDVIDEKPLFHAIVYTYNIGRCEIQIGHIGDILISGITEEEISDEIRYVLASAFIAEVPVIPNTKDLIQVLARYHRDLMVEGFTAPDDSGNRVRLRLTKSPGSKIETTEFLREISLTEPHSPAELTLLRESIIKELDRLSTVERIIGSLTVAIEQLSNLLSIETRNENKLQRCLTENPILFGLDYTRIIPKHRLGAEYEMDYALERVSGLYDLIEIEASNLHIFNNKGDPSKFLIHAEQQVLNWLEWLEKNYPYAQEHLPGLMRPKGYVIIGRNSSLSTNEYRKLMLRNKIFSESLEILTYDDLLNRAQNIEMVLSGQAKK
jgi:hypothetical protein